MGKWTDTLFGSTGIKSGFSKAQRQYQKGLIGTSNDIQNSIMESSYAGDYTENSYRDMQNALKGQMYGAIAANQHTNRLHGSQQGYRDSNIRQGFNQQMTNLAYQYKTQQQDWMQNYAQKAKDWNYTGKYQAMSLLSDPILKTDNVTTQSAGVFDMVNAGLGVASSAANLYSSISNPFGGKGSSASAGAKNSGLGGFARK